MRVLFTTSTFPRWEGDSEAPFVFLLARQLVKDGHEVAVLAPYAKGAKRYEVMSGVEVHRFQYFWPAGAQVLCYGAGMLPNMRSSLLALAQVPFFCISQIMALLKLNSRFKPDVIHAHWVVPQGLLAVLVRRLVGKPVVVTVHGSDLLSFQSGTKRKLVMYVLGKARVVTVNSSVTAKVASEVFMFNNSLLIPMGVELNAFRCSRSQVRELRKRLKVENAVILTVGRLIELKGIDYLIRAMPEVIRKHPGTKLIIIGDGPNKQQLQEQVSLLNLNGAVDLHGLVSADRIPAYFSAADVYVSPTITADDGGREAFGVTVLEALASGTPVVATTSGGTRDIISNGVTGLAVDEKSEHALADAINTVLEDRALKEDLVKNGLREVAGKFTWSVVAKQFSKIYVG